jgi:hypothetical protein
LQGRNAGELEEVRQWLESRFQRARPTVVALLGLRGAGQEQRRRQLARLLGVPFHELDALIEAAAGLTLPQIFELQGEAYYRRLERQALARFLSDTPTAVLATGWRTGDRTRHLHAVAAPAAPPCGCAPIRSCTGRASYARATGDRCATIPPRCRSCARCSRRARRCTRKPDLRDRYQRPQRRPRRDRPGHDVAPARFLGVAPPVRKCC